KNSIERSHGNGSRCLSIDASAFWIRHRSAWLNQHLHALSALSRFDPRHAARQIDHEFSAPQNVLPLSHNHRIAGKRHGVGFHIENAELAGRGLIFLRNNDATTCLKALDALLAAWPRTGSLKGFACVCWLTALLVEHHQRLTAQTGVALLHPYIAAEGRFFLLVADFQRRRLDVDRLIAILRKALQGIGWPLRRCLRARNQTARQKSDRE